MKSKGYHAVIHWTPFSGRKFDIMTDVGKSYIRALAESGHVRAALWFPCPARDFSPSASTPEQQFIATHLSCEVLRESVININKANSDALILIATNGSAVHRRFTHDVACLTHQCRVDSCAFDHEARPRSWTVFSNNARTLRLARECRAILDLSRRCCFQHERHKPQTLWSRFRGWNLGPGLSHAVASLLSEVVPQLST